jgi:cyclophilin family peptidyl-prolyl cis-trans isomerase
VTGRRRSRGKGRAQFESIEERILFAAPTLAAIPNVTLLAGTQMQIPLDGFDADSGDTLSYTVTATSGITTSVSPATNRSLKISVTHASSSSSGTTDPAFSGDMVLNLFEDRAPKTTARIISLAQSGFYNNLTFHRVFPNFVIQGGDPKGDGTGGSGVNFDDEFDPNLRFTGTGQLAMAKSYDDTNDSQFFITEGPQRNLDFNHTIFGQLIEGDNIREAIGNVAVDSPSHNMPLKPVTMTSVTVFADKQNRVLSISALPGVTSGSVTVTVNDGHGSAPATRTFTVTVAAETFNDPPYLLPIPDVVTRANTPVNVQVPAADVNGDAIFYLNWAGLYNNFAGTNVPVQLIPPDNQPPSGPRDINVAVDFNTGATTVTPTNNVAGVFPMYVGVAADLNAFDSQVVPLFVSPAAPSVDLVSASDTGVSASDNLTKLNNASGSSKLTFQVNNVLAGAVVTLTDGATQIGQATVPAGATSVTITTSGASAWADGAHNVTATQALVNYNYHIGNRIGTVTLTSLASATLAVTVDTVAPALTATPIFNYLTAAQNLVFSFSEDVSASLTPADLSLLNRQTNTTVPANQMHFDYAANQATLTFPGYSGGALPDGDYRATILAGAVTDAAGNALPAATPVDFYYMAGDVNHDRSVNFNDLVVLAQNYNTTGKTFAQGDFNYDTKVDFNDLVILAQRYNTTLATPATPLSASEEVAGVLGADSAKTNDEKVIFSTTPVRKPAAKKQAPVRAYRR